MASSSQAEPSPEIRQSNFEQGVALTLHLWPALTLAVQNNWGGPSSADKRDWFAGAIVDMFPSFVDVLEPQQQQTEQQQQQQPRKKPATTAPEEPDIEDVEATLLQVMLDEFEVNVDDDSAFETAETIMRVRAQCARDDFREVDGLRWRWEAGRGKKVAAVQAPDADQDTDGSDWESEDGDDDEEQDGDVEMGEAPALVAVPKEKPQPEVDEDGFTKVTRKKR